MEKILDKINEYYPRDENYNKELTKELCVLFGVSKSFLCLEEKETGKQTKCKEQCSYCRCK